LRMKCKTPARCRRFLFDRHSGMVRKHQTRNLEIPGSMLRIAPE
jgi:hypothetical protein